MAVLTPDKTDSVVVLAHSFVLHPDTLIGSAIAALTKRSVTIFMYHASVQVGANDDPGKFIVQTRPDAGGGSVDEHWVTVVEFTTVDGTAADEPPSGAEAADQTIIAVSSTTGFVADDLMYFHDTNGASPATATGSLSGDEARSEWCQCSKITATPEIVLFDGITDAKGTDDKMFNKCSRFIASLNLNALESYRVIFQHQATTAMDAHVKALAITHDSDTST